MVVDLNPTLFKINNFFQINVFGLFAATGFLVLTIFLIFEKDREKKINNDLLLQLLIESLLSSIFGAKLLFLLESGSFDVFSSDGFSLIGSFISLPIYMFFRLKMLGISFLYFADLISNYLPVFQAIARLGCLFVGCCSGIITQNKTFFIIYKNAKSCAPININLFPIQIVSVFLSILIFIILSILRKNNPSPGKIFGAYLIFEGSARFFVDFWRLSRTKILFENNCWSISSTQPIMVLLVVFGFIIFYKNDKR